MVRSGLWSSQPSIQPSTPSTQTIGLNGHAVEFSRLDNWNIDVYVDGRFINRRSTMAGAVQTAIRVTMDKPEDPFNPLVSK